MVKYLFFLLIILYSCTKNKVTDQNTIEGDKFYKEGEQLILNNNIEAYKKFQIAISYYNKSKDSSNISKSLICQSIAQKYSGDINGAEATLVESMKMMKPNDESLYSIYGNLGDLKYEQKEYFEATEWYNKALKENQNFAEAKNNILNNKAAAEFRQKKYSISLKTLQGISISKIKDLKLKYRIKENIEYVKWLKDNNYPAEREIKNLLNLKIAAEDYWGINSSYAHLAEINQVSNPKLSLHYAKQMLDIARKNKSPEDKLEAMARIMFVDNSLDSKKNFQEYKNLSDSIQNSRNDYKQNFAYIKYDSEKKEIENLKLQRDNNIKDFQFYSISVFSVLLSFFGVIWYRKRKQRMQLESENKLKEQQLKTSKKIHDVVANGIYQVMTKIENQDDFNKEQALDELEFVYEKSRDISYEKPESPNQEFGQIISNLIASFKNDEVNTFTVGNEQKTWQNIPEANQNEVYQIMRELLVNMRKHSKATNVVFKFEKTENSVNIGYSDNGIGISDELIFKNGLSNTVSRIENINGKITFDTKTEKGLKINISFPVS